MPYIAPSWEGVLKTTLLDLTPTGTSSSAPVLEEGSMKPWAFLQLKDTGKPKGMPGSG